MATLNQVLSVEKGIKTRVYADITELHQVLKKPALVSGFLKTFEAKNEEGETHPDEAQKVQYNATFTPGSDVLQRVTNSLTQLFDVIATKDWSNTKAQANVLVDGKIILPDVPATYLLFLVKQLADMTTFMRAVPELDPGITWSNVPDLATGLYTTTPTETQRTSKIQKALVLHPPTVEHPAQTAIVTEDVLVGKWKTTKYSGAISPTRKKQILARLEILTTAVNYALQHANTIVATEQKLGKGLMEFIFAV